MIDCGLTIVVIVFQVPVWGAGPGDGLCGVWSDDQPRDEKAAFSEAGVGCKSLLHPKILKGGSLKKLSRLWGCY